MENRSAIRKYIMQNNEENLIGILNNGLDPNFEKGWPIRLAARYGLYSVVKLFMRYGANPHLVSEAGATTLQLAVYSGEFWKTEKWNFLLSSCNSLQLADGAAVSIIFNNTAALKKIIDTGRCNPDTPTSLTGKTVKELANCYKLQNIVHSPKFQNNSSILCLSSPINVQRSPSDYRNMLTPQSPQRNLSPSVAKFFNQTASHSVLTSPRNAIESTFSLGFH